VNIEAEIQAFIVTEIFGGNNVKTPDYNENLVGSGMLDSLTLLQTLGFIQNRFSVDLLALATPEDYNSIQHMADAIRRFE
jgi:acyl carrier protein